MSENCIIELGLVFNCHNNYRGRAFTTGDAAYSEQRHLPLSGTHRRAR